MKKILIIFPDEWVSYSPTILNLVNCFEKKGDNVEVLAVKNNYYDNSNINNINIKFVDASNYIPELYDGICSYNLFKLFLLIKAIKKSKEKYDVVLGVDSIGYIAAKINYFKAIFLSLEVKKDGYFKLCRLLGIKKMIIQTKERKEYLLGNTQNRYYTLPNSPKYKEITNKLNEEKTIIYFGSISKQHGVDNCIEILDYLNSDYKLELHGILEINTHKYIFSKYKKHIKSGRLIISDTYIPENETIDYLSKYYIGLCFYDFRLIGENDFNYISCPSGKLYNYYAASLPVIGNDILGLESCKKFKCGKLLKNVSPKEIVKAIADIETDYKRIEENCINAAKFFDFQKYFDGIYKDL